MEDFLLQYEGCLLIVSHDRYFMDKVADTLFILEEDGSISGFVGKCSEYIEYREEKKREQALIQRETKREEKKIEISKTEPVPSQKKKRTFKEQKEFESLEQEILELEEQKTSLESQMSGGQSVDYEKLNRDYAIVNDTLTLKYERWEELAELE